MIRQRYTASQDISLPDSDYDYIECYFRVMGGSTQVLPPVKIEKGEMGACFLCSIDSNISRINSFERRVTLSSDGLTLTLGNCTAGYYMGSYSSGTNNAYLTLERIVAHKYAK